MKKDKPKDMISTFLGNDVSVEGLIKFKGTIRLDGKVKGKIYGDKGTVIVGEKAAINADLHVDVAIITGEVNGCIEASDKIEIFKPGRVIGDIKAPIITIEAGVVFKGNCEMKERTAPVKGTEIPLEKTFA